MYEDFQLLWKMHIFIQINMPFWCKTTCLSAWGCQSSIEDAHLHKYKHAVLHQKIRLRNKLILHPCTGVALIFQYPSVEISNLKINGSLHVELAGRFSRGYIALLSYQFVFKEKPGLIPYFTGKNPSLSYSWRSWRACWIRRANGRWTNNGRLPWRWSLIAPCPTVYYIPADNIHMICTPPLYWSLSYCILYSSW